MKSRVSRPSRFCEGWDVNCSPIETPVFRGRRRGQVPSGGKTKLREQVLDAECPSLKSQPTMKSRVPHPSRFCEGWDVNCPPIGKRRFSDTASGQVPFGGADEAQRIGVGRGGGLEVETYTLERPIPYEGGRTDQQNAHKNALLTTLRPHLCVQKIMSAQVELSENPS
jgi:hypothetical protein